MSRTSRSGCWETWITCGTVFAALLCATSAGIRSQALAAAEDKPKETVRLTVHHDKSAPKHVLVTLLSAGKAVRSKQLTAFTDDEVVTWEKVPIGSYELRFEADGYETWVKKIALAKEDKTLKFRVSLTRKVNIGTDAALRGLAERVKKLEGANAELKAAVGRLQKEIGQLKKK